MNILDYIRWRGDLTFKSDPFNDVDNLVFSQMIYADFDQVLKNKDSRMTIKEIADRLFALHDGDIEKSKQFGKDGMLVLREMSHVQRYENCVVYNYESILHADTTEQFTACMIDLPDHTTVVCFKGTDEHMIGWKEDCYLSYRDIASQEDALIYVNRYCKLYKTYRIIGHSKGGNLAIYAAVHCKPWIRWRIKEILSNDGPGLRPGSYDPKIFEKIKDRYTLIVPEKDAVGTIYELAPKKIIARVSTKNIVEAHGILTWQVSEGQIVKADNDSYQTDKTRLALLEFLKSSTEEERKSFIEEVFKAFDEAGITTVTQLAHGGFPVLLRAIKELSEIDSASKRVALKLAKVFSISVSSGLAFHKTVSEQASWLKGKARSLEGKIGILNKEKEQENTEEEKEKEDQ